MSTRITATVALTVGACGLIGYGLGCGWIRLGPPGRDPTRRESIQLESHSESPGVLRAELLQVPPFDDHVIQAQVNTSAPTAASAPAPAASTAVAAPPAAVATAPAPAPAAAPTSIPAATTIKELHEVDPEASSGGTSPAPIYITRDLKNPVPLRSTKFSVVIDSPDPQAVVSLGSTRTQKGAQNGALFDFDLSNRPDLAGRQEIVLTAAGTSVIVGKTVVEVIVPKAGLLPPTITTTSNGVDMDPTPAPDDTATPPHVTVYGHYLKLFGQDAPNNASDLDFYLYVSDGNNFVLTGSIPDPGVQIDSSSRTWYATLKLPDLPLGTPARIFAVTETSDNQRFSKKLTIQRDPIAFEAGKKPSIDAIYQPGPDPANPAKNALKSDPRQDTSGARFFVSSKRLIFHGINAKKNTRVLICVDGKSEPVAKTDVLKADGDWQTPLSDEIQDQATHTVRATMSQGDQERQFSDPVTFLVSTKGPTLDSVSVTSPGTPLGAPALSVRFRGNQLDPDLAQKPSNYTLQPSNGSGFFDASAATQPDRATFDPARNVVILSFKVIKPNDYQLQLATDPNSANGQTLLKDLYGNPISPPTALAVTRSADGYDAADAIPRADKAPNAVFPEFNNPRPETNGFNPSDHVDTRVSRLYFYRDARRVAEIINRDLKSYNQAAVDTRRRLAEKARTSADTLTDQRRLQEVKAVRAAQATREAQRRLDQAQADLQQTQAMTAKANQDLNTLQTQQASLQQQLNAARAAAAQPTGTNAATTSATPTPDQAAAAAAATTIAARLDTVNQQIAQAQSQVSQAATQSPQQNAAVQSAQAELQSARGNEAQSSDETLKNQAQEDRARESQFRLEVAAAHEDPNFYVPGQPDSVDPVLQVSISVIGEGVLQLRGPIKGINIVRRMINEIDSPAGQVRIALHTVQINGEHEDRMEKVASRIQAYVDHSRFLTVQSAQMLRNSVVKVASRKAEEACAEPMPDQWKEPEKWAASQQLRDRKYQESFFGVDFINELHEIDAEFLHTGNKLLSLHSMDTTSLASALFMLALAKNETRMEILEEFKRQIETELPEAEMNYEQSSGRTGKEHHLKVLPLAQNARFQSIMGFFNAEVSGTDTLNPLQREFIKLAQILKSRLVTELEYTQRFKERGLIEDRLGNYIEELRKQKQKEQKAKDELENTRNALNDQKEKLQAVYGSFHGTITNDLAQVDEIDNKLRIISDLNRGMFDEGYAQVRAEFLLGDVGGLPPPFQDQLDEIRKTWKSAGSRETDLPFRTEILTKLLKFQHVLYTYNESLKAQKEKSDDDVKTMQNINNFFDNVRRISDRILSGRRSFEVAGLGEGFTLEANKQLVSESGNKDAERRLEEEVRRSIEQILRVRKLFNNFRFDGDCTKALEDANFFSDRLAEYGPDDMTALRAFNRIWIAQYKFRVLAEHCIKRRAQEFDMSSRDLLLTLSETDSPARPFSQWTALRRLIRETFTGTLLLDIEPLIKQVDDGFQKQLEAYIKYRTARENAAMSRQPLDAKKLLDMLLDEIEDKYIELLEGIRAHTANIDGYVKSIATALDDDFNTQFYYPAFQEIRKSSTYWDVQLGQVETTNILTNNRMFAKVEPQATMEFDLPKRDILINEAMNGAKALMDSYGALVTDPSFLALTKMQSGQPTSSPAQGFGGANTVRNVLPGLPRSNDEQLLSQAPAGRREFGSPLEALIPDPAIYKFETGTGFEIRPVIQPDGQSVVFHLDYMYTTNVREPVRADEKHLGRIKRHFIDTEVQLGNYELREVSRYVVALKASRTSRGVPLFEDIPGLGILFRPLPSASSSLQQNVILGQSTIFPTLFDLMGLRIAPAVADLDTLRLRNSEFLVRGRARDVSNRVFDYSTSRVDESLRVPPAERRPDLYRTQETIPDVHPNGYHGPGLNLKDSQLQEGYDPTRANPPTLFTPADSSHAQIPSQEGASSWLSPSRLRGIDSETKPISADASGTRAPSPRSALTLLPTRPLDAPIPAPSTTLRPSMGQGATSPVSSQPLKPASAASRPVIPMPKARVTNPARGPSQPVIQPSGPVAGSTHTTGRSTSDPATRRASAAPTEPAPVKAPRRSVLSRLFGTNKQTSDAR